MGKLALVAEVRRRRLALRCLVHVTRASWQIVLDSWQQASSRIAQTECTHLPELLVHRANQWASMDVCDRKRGGCGAIMNYVHTAASIAHKISQRAAQIVEGAHTKEKEDVACPRCDRELYVFNTASGPILRCRGWTLAGTPCTLIKACHKGVIIPGGLQNTNRTEGGNSASGCKPSLGTGTVRSVATSPSTVSAPSISTAARGDVDDGSLASAPRGRRIHWGPVECGHGNGSDWCVIVNHQQDKSSNDRFNCKKWMNQC